MYLGFKKITRCSRGEFGELLMGHVVHPDCGPCKVPYSNVRNTQVRAANHARMNYRCNHLLVLKAYLVSNNLRPKANQR